MFKIKNTDGKARLGVLETAHGKIETPFFMPVATKLTVKHVTVDDLEEMGARSIISNAYVQYLRPGLEVVRNAGGSHRLMGWKHCMFTDSGGFQMLNPTFLLGIDDKKVVFKDPFALRKETLTPEKVMDIERALGSDVAMCLDHVPPVKGSKEEIADAVRRTGLWAERCKKHHDGKTEYGTKQMLFGIAQGGLFEDLRVKSAQQIDALDFDGIAIGGLCIGETREEMFRALDWQMPHFSTEKPKYLMGVGSPIDVLEAVSRGVDCFDSIFPTQNARHCNLFTREGMIKLDKGKHRLELGPIDPECGCYVCKNHSRSYLHHLARSSEWTHHRFVSYHNVNFLINMMKEIRTAIKENSFEEYRKEFLRRFKK